MLLKGESMNGKIDDKALYEFTGINMIGGIVTIIFGVVALVWPGITLVSLSLITAIWLFVSGITGTISSIFLRNNYQHWILRLLFSILQIGIGAYLVQRPALTIATYVLLIGITFIVDGTIEFAMAFMQDKFSYTLLGIIGGLLSIAAGILIWRYPVSGSLAFVWVLGLVAIFSGTLAVVKAVELRHDLKERS